MKYDPFYTSTIHDKLEQTLAKIELVASFIATYKQGDPIANDGMYYVLEDAVDDIRELFEFASETPMPELEPKPESKPLKRAA